jgi:hypothetical protein
MYTSALLLALATYTAQSVLLPIGPQWMNDYSLAFQRGQKEKKPLAVFVASGAHGWDRLSRDGKLSADIEQILSASYVCVYLDADKDENKQLASSFDLARSQGLIISDSTGSKQAFRSEERMSNAEMTLSLKKFADPDLVVRTTETTTQPPVYTPARTIRVQNC